jgi:hypothetical protein
MQAKPTSGSVEPRIKQYGGAYNETQNILIDETNQTPVLVKVMKEKAAKSGFTDKPNLISKSNSQTFLIIS